MSTCTNKYTYRRQLSNHQKTVHSDPDVIFECPTCQKIFKQRENLRRHTKVHMTDKVLHCEYCNQNFTRTDQLRIHQKKCMIPNRKENFICSVCHKNFNSEKIFKLCIPLLCFLVLGTCPQIWESNRPILRVALYFVMIA